LEGQFHRLRQNRACDLYHETDFIPLPSDRPTVATLHDLSVLLHPEWHPPDRVAFYEQQLPRVLAQACHFLTVSEFSRQEAIQHLGIAPERVTRTCSGVRPRLGPRPAPEVHQTLRQLQLPARYLLYVGTLEPRKNLLLLLRAYCAVPASLRDRWPLLLVGKWGWNTGALAHYLHEVARHRGVIHLGYLPEAYLPALYNGARALVYPSLYEGFGLPPVEMLACGGVVLASTAGATVETVGGQAHLIHPEDLDGWRDALIRVTTDDEWWQALRQGGPERVRHYTWDQCAAATWRVYRRLGGSQEPAAALPQRKAG
jgi:alpha-1,3-rhamnosyl/mannosyltransferase